MAILEMFDVHKILELWKKKSNLGKIYSFLNGFFLFSSIASLSDVLFSWSGVFKEAIKLYRGWIGEPIQQLLTSIGLTEVSKYDVDVIIMMSIIFCSSVRIYHVAVNFLPDVPRPDLIPLAYVVILVVYILHLLLFGLGKVDHISLVVIFGIYFSYIFYHLCRVAYQLDLELAHFETNLLNSTLVPVLLAVFLSIVSGVISSILS